ncbi:hypothetical protein LX36DRAFT_457128 [Colletotrichum falcatum]|nr:hypothetical protein LX36DRAFT_457128 [Colletotrichum falcatum]
MSPQPVPFTYAPLRLGRPQLDSLLSRTPFIIDHQPPDRQICPNRLVPTLSVCGHSVSPALVTEHCPIHYRILPEAFLFRHLGRHAPVCLGTLSLYRRLPSICLGSVLLASHRSALAIPVCNAIPVATPCLSVAMSRIYQDQSLVCSRHGRLVHLASMLSHDPDARSNSIPD